MMARLAEPLRVCRVCGLEARNLGDLELFVKNKKCKYGRDNRCTKCMKEQDRKHYAANREMINERNKKYHDAHPEKVKEQNRKYYEANREKIKEYGRLYYIANRKKINERNKKYSEANPEKVKERKRKYRKANPEKVKEIYRRYCEVSPFKNTIRLLKYRSKKKGLDFDINEDHLKQLWNECRGICSMTGVPMLKNSEKEAHPFVMSLDRIIPDKGYIKENVRFVSNWYNLTRRHWGDSFTLEMCQRVAERAYSPKMIEILEGGNVNG